MSRLLPACLLAAILLAASVLPLFAQPAPQFRLGFKALADQIPQVVGQPVENEHHAPNGDSLQQTTTGLLVWRKADNWTAFTNGSRTWVNGPNGVMERGNEERFEWEAARSTQDSLIPQSGSSQVELPLDILSVTSPVRQGERATLAVSTTPGVVATLALRGPSGLSWPAGADPLGTDCSGKIVWDWTVNSGTPPGTWRIVVTAIQSSHSATAETEITVTR